MDKNWRDKQPELDRAREVIAQAQCDYHDGKKNNPYPKGTQDYEHYELGWFDAKVWDDGDET